MDCYDGGPVSHPQQIDIREIRPGTWTLEFPYEESFIAYLKDHVVAADRSYDPDTKTWTINGGYYMKCLESVAVQKFWHAIKTYRNKEGKLVIANLKTGRESIQEE